MANQHKNYEVYEEDGGWFFNGRYGNKFGPYTSEDSAENSSCEAEACEY